MAHLQIIAMNPQGFPGGRAGLAAERAGHCGFLNIESCSDGAAVAALEEAVAVGGPSGLAVSALGDHRWALIARFVERSRGSVLICDPQAKSLNVDIARLHTCAATAFVQATSAEEAEHAAMCGADAIVIKGGESGGRVGEETAFILLQRVAPRVTVPIWVRGGVGMHTAAACLAGGAAGVVLDWQLALCRECELPADVRERVVRMDGSETAILGQDLGWRYRAYARPGEVAFAQLKEIEDRIISEGRVDPQALDDWRREVEGRAGAERNRLLLIGQDAAFAAPLAAEHRSVKGVCDAIAAAARSQCRIAARDQALRPDGPMGVSHGTKYPIVQGPMTRVSDTAQFALAVADGGGLPFLALALLRGPQVAKLLEETKERLGKRPWGIGILGFVPRELRDEQLAEVRKHPPPYALIAGGRPDQAESLERDGIKTYLHIPSPALLKMYLEAGVRRVIFEGRECGGHVGPRTSFVLWDSMIRVIVEHLAVSKSKPDEYHVLFAGGVHDDVSAAMVAAMAAPLSERGVRIGVLMGTSYLFTKEAVEAGAILRGFQQEAIECQQTVLLETGVGHATRCADTEFGKFFAAEKRRLMGEGKSKEEIRDALEQLNLGRLRIASKGVSREDVPQPGSAPRYVQLDEKTQHANGMYMIGQVAALRDRVCSIGELHDNVSRGGVERLELFAAPARHPGAQADSGSRAQAAGGTGAHQNTSIRRPPFDIRKAPSDVAIVGMSCIFPKAGDLWQFWENILNKKNAITEIPADRWNWELYFNGDRTARNRIYSRWGGFIDEIPFDPMRYGMPPNSLPSIEPLQLLVLEAVRQALEDSRYGSPGGRAFNRERTSVVLGAGGGVADLGLGYGFRALLPYFMAEAGGSAKDAEALIERLDGALPEWTEDSFAGLLMNVAAGRIANRFDLGGTNYTVDAACASSLAAVRLGVSELESGASDMVIVGGADTMQSPFAYLCFSKTQALSPTGACKSFDESGDGIVISEGIAMVVLKRLADANRDGDRVYAVIKGVGASSDGKDKGLTAPRPAGQVRALERAYEKAGLDPRTVGLIEAHGTGTVAGDQSEVESLTRAFTAAGAAVQGCALGSVKSTIGHTKCTAGVAGLIKAALALHHKILPPTMGVVKPNPKAKFDQSPFYVNTETRPWIGHKERTPRRAGVSAFGFGGTNFHAVLEEHVQVDAPRQSQSVLRDWPVELFVWRGDSVAELVQSIDRVATDIAGGAQPTLPELAAAVWESGRDAKSWLSIVADSLDDLQQKMARAKAALATNPAEIRDPSGIYFSSIPLARGAKVAFLFPGQGSQSVNMLCDLAVAMPCVRETFEQADAALGDALGKPLSSFVFPHPKFAAEDQGADERALTETNVAQPAIGTADLAMLRVLESLEIKPDVVAGHSYGEYVALHAAGVMSQDDLVRVSEARGRLIAEAGRANPGAMAAASADERAVSEALRGISGVVVANLNGPLQTVISGEEGAIDEAVRVLSGKGIAAKRIRVSCAFHSPLVAGAQGPFAQVLSGVQFARPRIAVYSNTTASSHEGEPDEIRRRLVDHLVQPVRFVDQLRAMHDARVRVFIEVGPGRVLTGLVEKTLAGRTFAAINTDQSGRNGLVQLVHAVAQMAASGVRMDLYPLYEGRIERCLDLDRLVEQTKPTSLPPTTWMVNGARARPLNGDRARPKPAAAGTHNPAGSTNGNGAATALRGDQAAYRSAPARAAPVLGQSSPEPRMALAAPVATNNELSHPLNVVGVDAAMAGYHSMMTRFLDTQKNVMLAYLRGAAEGQHDFTASSSFPTAPGPALPAIAGIEFRPPQQLTPAISEAMPITAPENGKASVAIAGGDALPSEDRTLLTHELLVGRLLSIVSERTGYPPEMLDLDSDLEADLGIDSIKRIEILGTLQGESILPGASIDAEMETLAKLKTLRSIASWIMERAGDGTERISGIKSAPQQTSNPKRRPEEVEAAIPRMVLRAVAEPLRSEPTKGIAGGVLIVGGDREIEQRLAERLVQKGISIVGASSTTQTNGAQQGHKDSEPGAVKDFLGRLRQTGRPIGGLLYLAPLCRPSGVDAENCSAWALSAGAESIALFNLVQQLEQDLRSNNGRVVVATAMDGAFGTSDDVESEFWPGHGGVCAIAKTLNREWPEVAATVVDFDSAADTAFIADRLASEFIARGESEIGYRGGGRVTLRPCPQPIVATESRMDLNRDGVVLLTGGARGITAEIATELAERFQPKLILVGRSELPSARERPLTAGITDVRQLKVVLREQIEASGEKPTPAKIEAAFARLQQERDIRASLAAMRAAGSIVEYVAVDVNDSAAFGQAIDRVYAKYGRLDGVVHGAGITEDKLIRDKTVESFRRVLGPKVNGACTLAAKLRLDSLKFLFFFSSVSARYGNRGQADYAAANEFLNKMAQRLNRRWAARVASINWGPWAGPADGGGMVSMELAKQFAKAGVVVVSRPAGRRLFIDELLHGDKADVEVVYGGPLSIADDRTTRTEEASPVDLSAQAWPLLNARAVITRDDDGAIECQRTLDANYDLYLLDHQLDGRPVMPMAMSLELLAEVAATVDPKMNVTAVRDLRVLKGVMLQSGPEDLRLRAVPERTAHGIDVAIKADAGGDWPHPCYKATVELRPQIRPVAAPAPLSLRHPQPLSMSIDEAYEKWLFHGPLFAGIVDVQGLGENGIIATLAPSSPRRLLAEGNPGAPGHWLIDPVVVDSGLQLLILWARTYMDMTPLPSRLGCYYRNADALQSDVRCEVHIRSTRTSPSIHADLVLRDASGFVVGWLEDMEVTCSKALNRLSATRASSAGAKA